MNRRVFLVQSSALLALAALPQPLQAQARFRPNRFSVQVRGRGPDVIMIPGLTSGRYVWESTVRAVPGHRYHLVQVSGFAGEPARGNASGAVVSGIVEELAAYIRSARLNRPAVVGHSMGGTVGMMLAARHPDLVGRLMVVDMLPRPTSLFGGDRAGELASALGSMASDPIGRRLLSTVISAFTPAEDRGRESDPDVVARAMQELGTIDLTQDVGRIRAPVTVLYAAGGVTSAAAEGRTFAQAYRNLRGVRLLPIVPSGHMIMLDQPGRVAAALRMFLR